MASEPELNIAGTVTGTGEAEMKSSTGRWIDISGKTYPFTDKAEFRTGRGGISISAKNGTRVEIGCASRVVSSEGSAIIETGHMKYKIPAGTPFEISTLTAAIRFDPASEVQGYVSFNGEKTLVKSLKGKCLVQMPGQGHIVPLAEGSAISISFSAEHRGYIIANASFSEPSLGECPGDPPDSKKMGYVIGGGLAVGGGAGLIWGLNSGSSNRVASPSVP